MFELVYYLDDAMALAGPFWAWVGSQVSASSKWFELIYYLDDAMALAWPFRAWVGLGGPGLARLIYCKFQLLPNGHNTH